jgi:hypothetical protein
VKPTGRVESPLADPAQAPSQGGEGAPPAWLVIGPHKRASADPASSESSGGLDLDLESIVQRGMRRHVSS